MVTAWKFFMRNMKIMKAPELLCESTDTALHSGLFFTVCHVMAIQKRRLEPSQQRLVDPRGVRGSLVRPS
eukprot:s1216_g4.t1